MTIRRTYRLNTFFFLLAILFILPAHADAQAFHWLESVYVYGPGVVLSRIADVITDDEGIIIIVTRHSNGLNLVEDAVVSRRDRDGEEEWSSTLTRYVDPALSIKSNYVIIGAQVVPTEDEGMWVWTFYDYRPGNVEYPMVIIRHRLGPQGTVQQQDSLKLDFRTSSQSFVVQPNGSIRLKAVSDLSDGVASSFTLRYWDGDLAQVDSIVTPLPQEYKVDAQMVSVDDIVTDKYVAILMANAYTFKTVLILYDRQKGVSRVTEIDMAAEDLAIDDGGDVLVLGRTLGGAFVDGVQMQLARVKQGSTIEFYEPIIGQLASAASIVGVTRRGEIYLKWQEVGGDEINVLNPDGSPRGRFHVYAGAIEYYLSENADLYVVLNGWSLYGRLQVNADILSVHRTTECPYARFDLQ